MLMRGLFSELLDYYLSLNAHSLADVERGQGVNRLKTGIAGSSSTSGMPSSTGDWTIS